VIPHLLERLRRNLQAELLLPALTVGLVASLAGSFGLYALFKDHARDEMSRWAVSLADSVNYAAETSGDLAALQRFVTALGAEPDIRTIVVTAGEPATILATTRLAWWRQPLAELSQGAVRSQLVNQGRQSKQVRWSTDASGLITAVPLRIHRPEMDPGRLAAGSVYVELDARDELARQRLHAALAGGGLGLAILLMTALGLGLIRARVIRPLRAIQDAVEQRQAGDQSVYAPVERDNEIGLLARATNRLLDVQEERESLFRQMFSAHPAVKLLLDAEDGTIVDLNQAAEAFYGYSRQELIGQPISRINTLAEDRIQEVIEQVGAEGGLRAQFQHRLANGELRDVIVQSGIVSVGGHAYLHSIVQDVTEENRYRKQLETYGYLFENLPLGVFRASTDSEGRFLELNPAMAALFSAADTADLARHSPLSLYHDPADRRAILDQLVRTGEIRRREVRLQRLDGTPMWGSLTAYLYTDEDGTDFVDGILEDISERKAAEAERDRLVEILEGTPDFVSFARPDGTILYINRGGRRLLGLPSASGDLDDTVPETVQPDPKTGPWRRHPEWARQKIEQEGIPTAVKAGSWTGETALIDTLGREIPVSQVILAHRDEQGEVERLSTVMRDISERKATEDTLRQTERQLRTLLEHFPGAVLFEDPERRVVLANHRFTELFRIPQTPDELVGADCRSAAQAVKALFNDPEGFVDGIEQRVSNQTPVQGEPLTMTDDSVLERDYIPIPSNSGLLGHLWLYRDVTERASLEAELQHQASHDRLTDTYNRLKAEEILEQEKERSDRYGTSFAVVMFDIDRFKAVNDVHGHDIGDAVLRQIVRLAENRLRSPDTLARWGGEEFMVVLPETEAEGARELAERLRETVAEHEFPGPGGVTISLGVATHPPARPLKTLLKEVDDALYQAKNQGRNRVEVVLT